MFEKIFNHKGRLPKALPLILTELFRYKFILVLVFSFTLLLATSTLFVASQQSGTESEGLLSRVTNFLADPGGGTIDNYNECARSGGIVAHGGPTNPNTCTIGGQVFYGSNTEDSSTTEVIPDNPRSDEEIRRNPVTPEDPRSDSALRISNYNECVVAYGINGGTTSTGTGLTYPVCQTPDGRRFTGPALRNTSTPYQPVFYDPSEPDTGGPPKPIFYPEERAGVTSFEECKKAGGGRTTVSETLNVERCDLGGSYFYRPYKPSYTTNLTPFAQCRYAGYEVKGYSYINPANNKRVRVLVCITPDGKEYYATDVSNNEKIKNYQDCVDYGNFGVRKDELGRTHCWDPLTGNTFYVEGSPTSGINPNIINYEGCVRAGGYKYKDVGPLKCRLPDERVFVQFNPEANPLDLEEDEEATGQEGGGKSGQAGGQGSGRSTAAGGSTTSGGASSGGSTSASANAKDICIYPQLDGPNTNCYSGLEDKNDNNTCKYNAGVTQKLGLGCEYAKICYYSQGEKCYVGRCIKEGRDECSTKGFNENGCKYDSGLGQEIDCDIAGSSRNASTPGGQTTSGGGAGSNLEKVEIYVQGKKEERLTIGGDKFINGILETPFIIPGLKSGDSVSICATFFYSDGKIDTPPCTQPYIYKPQSR